MATERTEPLRAEHRDLVPKLDALRALGAGLDTWEPGREDEVLAEVIVMLRHHQLPHARAEEALLYPAVEQAMNAPGAMATMIADHREIARRIEALAGTGAAIDGKTPRPDQLEDLRAQLLGLWAILLLHLEKEEDILLPILDAHLSVEEAQALFDGLAAYEHEHLETTPTGR